MTDNSVAMLAGKTAIITGAATGLGRATALAFAEAGANVVAADVAAEAGEETAHAIAAAGGRALFVRTDVSNGDDVARMVATAVAEYGSVDCAFNNAGIAPRGAPIAEMSGHGTARAIHPDGPPWRAARDCRYGGLAVLASLHLYHRAGDHRGRRLYRMVSR